MVTRNFMIFSKRLRLDLFLLSLFSLFECIEVLEVTDEKLELWSALTLGLGLDLGIGLGFRRGVLIFMIF